MNSHVSLYITTTGEKFIAHITITALLISGGIRQCRRKSRRKLIQRRHFNAVAEKKLNISFKNDFPYGKNNFPRWKIAVEVIFSSAKIIFRGEKLPSKLFTLGLFVFTIGG